MIPIGMENGNNISMHPIRDNSDYYLTQISSKTNTRKYYNYAKYKL